MNVRAAILISALLATLFASAVSFAQCPGSPPAGVDCVASGANKDITAFTVCSKITNSHASGKALFVPVNSSGEWSTFRSNLPSGVTSGACGGAPAPSIVQYGVQPTGVANGGGSVNLPGNCTVGNTVLAVAAGRLSTDSGTSVTGLGYSSWTKVNSGSQAANNVEIWVGKCVTAGAGIIMSFSSTNVRTMFSVEVANVGTTVEVASSAGTGGGWAIAVPTFTTTNSTFLFGAGTIDKQATFSTISNGWTTIATADSGSGGTRVTGTIGYKVISTGGSQGTIMTLSGTGSPTSTGIGIGMY